MGDLDGANDQAAFRGVMGKSREGRSLGRLKKCLYLILKREVSRD